MKLKKFLPIILLALVLMSGLFGCKQEQPKDTITYYALTEDRRFNASGELMQHYRYSYDQQGLLIGLEVDNGLVGGCDGKPDRAYTATYNEQGYLSYYETCNAPDANGQLVMTAGVQFSYEYDEANRPIRCSAGDKAYRYEYDTQGRILRVLEDGQEIVRLEYDGDGNPVSALLGQTLQTYSYKQGLPSSVAVSYGAQPQHYLRYTYDEQGNFLTVTKFDSSGNQDRELSFIHAYDEGALYRTIADDCTLYYDSNGNITRVEYENGEYYQYSYTPMELTPVQAQRCQMQWDYKQGSRSPWAQLELPIQWQPELIHCLLPNLSDYWR